MLAYTSIVVDEIAAADWIRHSRGFADLNVEQTLTYGNAAAERIGGKARFIGLVRGGMPLAVACIRIRTVPGLGRGIAWIASGPLVQRRGARPPSPEELTAILGTLREEVCDRQGHILRLRLPAWPGNDPDTLSACAVAAGFKPTDRAASYRTVILDLSQGVDRLMRGLHGKWRNMLRKAQRNALELDRGPLSELAERFHALYREVQATKGFRPDIPPEFYYPLRGGDFVHEALIAHSSGRDLAGMTIGRAGGTMIYLFGATTEPGRSLNAGYHLMWEAMCGGVERGLEWFDLGGIDQDVNPDVTRFKRRTGGLEIAGAGPFEARPAGLAPQVIELAETLRTRVKR